ncbi:AsnC family transcriptional regulator [Rhodococcoides trifolii]|uniref:AsnC family transcriptional regulator n=1 Tax=Rhodococcoides trifolii TaxID=908250 RepID=A0A917LHP4_9NOCA|nr:AsnC family transcriptional regulator [Rhodococcus trifolii]GGG24444.1 AsnC family transcriptional regulator [Rhodococcus trifolii]
MQPDRTVKRPQPYVADHVDRGILRLLQTDARRPFSSMAAELGVSDQTVARRYQRLRDRAGVRVVALTEPNPTRHELWLLRIRSAANNVDSLMSNLAVRTDTAWISTVAGPQGVESTTMVFRERTETGFALVRELSAQHSVASVSAQLCMSVFFGGPDSLLTKDDGPLEAGHPTNLPKPRARNDHDPDGRLLQALSIDGRASLKQLSRASGLSEDTAQSRVHALAAEGAFYFDVDFDPTLLGYTSTFAIWATVAPAQLSHAGIALARHREVSFAAATTGNTNLYAVAHCVDDHAMYRYITGDLARLPGIQHVETAPHLRSIKRARRDLTS